MILVIKVNPYKPNVISLSYQLGQLISILRFARWYFLFLFLIEHSISLNRRRFMRCLVRVCTVCLCPTKRILGLSGLM